MAEKIDETHEENSESVSKTKKKERREPVGDSWSDLRVLLLILVLTVIVFFVLLYKQKHPQEYAESVVRAKEGAGAAYSKAGEVLPKTYQDVGWFLRYALDYGKAADLPLELPKVRIPADSVVTESVPAVSSGSVSSTGSASGTGTEAEQGEATGASEKQAPLVVEFSGYRLEFDRPPAEAVTLSVAGAKMTVSPAIREKKDNSQK